MIWRPGDRLLHGENPELGPGVVRRVDGRTLQVEFPTAGRTLQLAAGSDALRPLVWQPGARATLRPGGEEVRIEALLEGNRVRLADGRAVAESELWPIASSDALAERLARGDVDPLEDFALRLDLLHLAAVREADGLGSFLGGRIRLFPHQLHVAERATRSDPVRWLLADEVGLGKTVEACLILNHLLRTGRADRALVVAPATLTVQWLGELWRKYHQVFVLLDEPRLLDVERVYGTGFNPFEAYHRVVVSLEFLVDRPELTALAAAAGLDLLIVDEAHRLRRPPRHPGHPEYRTVQPLTEASRHVLLLTATPLEEDAHGFFRLLQLLRPEQFPEDDFATRLAEATPLPPCTSATRRADIGGLPPRQPRPVDLAEDRGWQAWFRIEQAVRALPAGDAAARREKARRLQAALASPQALEAILPARETALIQTARAAARLDPRVEWIARQAARWFDDGDKTLIFVARRETLEPLRAALAREAQLRTGVFHEELSAVQRDIEVAQFRLPGGPSMLISTECGGEGRNFEFCTRLVLFDLPWSPMTVEQRIGRLDRIGRSEPVEIVYFRPPQGLGAALAELYEHLGLFERPLGGLHHELAGVEARMTELALSDAERPAVADFAEIIERTDAAVSAIELAAYHQLHCDPFRNELGASILARVPGHLEELTREVTLAACDRLGLHVEEHRQGQRHSIELDSRARVESLPGVPGGSSFLGTFDREEAVDDEGIDFFASGHPFIEGLLTHLDDSALGRVALLHLGGAEKSGFGLLALYRKPTGFGAVAIDVHGQERPDWVARVLRRPLRSRRANAEQWTTQPSWPELIRSLARRLEAHGRPAALAALRVEAGRGAGSGPRESRAHDRISEAMKK